MTLVNDNNVEQNFLNDSWSLRFHDPFDNDWSKRSYKPLYEISTIQNYWEVNELLKDKMEMGMFFLFRENVFPLWDDENNAEGGALSMKILKTDAYNCWLDLTIKMLSENLIKEKYRDLTYLINGISVVPKKTFCILKIWVKTTELKEPEKFNILDKYHGKVLFAPWKTT